MSSLAWRRGDQRRLAAYAGISPQQLCDIIHHRKACYPELARKLEEGAEKLGYTIPRTVWVFLDLRKGNPLFPPPGDRKCRL